MEAVYGSSDRLLSNTFAKVFFQRMECADELSTLTLLAKGTVDFFLKLTQILTKYIRLWSLVNFLLSDGACKVLERYKMLLEVLRWCVSVWIPAAVYQRKDLLVFAAVEVFRSTS